MNKIIALFFNLAILFTLSCGGGSNCEQPGSPIRECDGKNLGNYFLKEASLNFIDSNPSINFKNTSGFTTTYMLREISNNYSKQPLLYNQYTTPSECFDHYTYSCYDYATIESQYFKYYSSKIPLNFFYKRESFVIKDNEDSLKIGRFQNGFDKVSIFITTPNIEIEFQLPYGGPMINKWKILDSISLNNLTFYNVHSIFNDTAKLPKNQIIPAGIYYTQEKKLIGFYLSNGEVWGIY